VSGTRIGGDARDIPVNTVKAVSSINVSMISINVHPSAHAAVGKSIMEGLLAVEAEPLQVVFSKFESKYTLLVAREDEAKVINQLTSKQLYGEIARREVEPPRTTGKPMSVVAAVGQGITHLEAQFFRAFKNSGIHLYMISHTPRSISVVIPESEVRRAITAVHDAFFKRNLVSLVVLSDANNVINDVFLRLVHAHYKKEGKNRRLAVRGVYDCVAARIVLDEKVLDAAFQAAEPPRWNDLLSSAAAKPFDANEADIKSLVASVYRGHYLHSTIVDISDRVECNALYAPLVGEGFDLISLNRGALNAPAPRPQESPKASAKSVDMAGEERKGGDEAAATASGGGGVAEDDVFEVLELREDEGAAEALVKRRDGMRQIDLLLQLERLHGFNFMYDSAICPGVPLVSTIRDMRQRGDRILRVELNVSVSVQAALAALRSGKVASFSEAVRASREFLEPDPRTDLSGTFVAEKARILGRELAARVQLEVEQLLPDRLKVTSQSPATWEPIAPDAVLDSLREIDDVVGKRFKAAESKGSRLVYVAELQVTMDEAGNDVARGKLLLREYPASHPFASTSTLVQAIAIESERTEGRSPIFLVYPAANTLQGALGVFGDTLTLTSIADTR
jgi:homoserine dehydrogenase